MKIEKMMEDIKKQLANHENETSYGEPQAFVSLRNGRSIEITLEQEGLAESKQFYSVRLHCSDAEYENGEYHATVGIIDSYNSGNADVETVRPLIESALMCNKSYPIADYITAELKPEDVKPECTVDMILTRYFYSGPAEYGKAYDKLVSLLDDLETLGVIDEANSIIARINERR